MVLEDHNKGYYLNPSLVYPDNTTLKDLEIVLPINCREIIIKNEKFREEFNRLMLKNFKYKCGLSKNPFSMNDLIEWGIVFNEVINFFRKVKNNSNGHNESNRKEKRSQEFPDDVKIEGLQKGIFP